MFLALFVVIILLLLLGMYYLATRIRNIILKGEDPKKVTKEKRRKAMLIAAVVVLPLFVWCILKPYVAVVAVLHLIIFWALIELVFSIVDMIRNRKNKDTEAKKKQTFPCWLAGALAIVICSVYMGAAYYLAHHVYETRYEIKTTKTVAPLRIALIADSHIGACFDGEGFAEHIKTIEKQNPDILVISGDYVDDDTKRADMEVCCAALGNMKTTYGVFYVPGNHDKGYSSYRDFTYDDLISELKKNNVTVLQDEVAEVGENYYVVGRKDRSMKRMDISELTASLDPSKFVIVLDHQPNDYKAESQANCDLVLSGHTHGGQMIPIGPFGELIGANDATYGKETRGNTTFIVTSGIADWAIPYKTGTISEYVLIDVN
ncbi:MAG: metallophosphoesterase [Clostridiales bacterium]|nr:metallophosphoesterase [Clostridiales bacterium]